MPEDKKEVDFNELLVLNDNDTVKIFGSINEADEYREKHEINSQIIELG